MVRYFLFSLLFISGFAEAQKLKKDDKLLLANLQGHVKFLSSDQLEGRRTGSVGEKMAAEYVSSIFRSLKLKPKGTQDYLQPFDIAEGNEIHSSTHLIINEHSLALNKEFFPLGYGANASLSAMPSPALQEEGTPWFLDVKDIMEDNKENPHFDLADAVKKKASDMQAKGATAVFIYNSSDKNDGLAFAKKEVVGSVGVPVVYLSKTVAEKFLADESASLDIKLKSEVVAKKRTAFNVIGYVDNSAPTTVILGAHFDHLGLGEDGNSMLRNSAAMVHNGADDNASGTAALMELARLTSLSKNKNHNYLFIAFSGEELGLHGSKYFVENPTIDLASVNYMINMDMIGRLNDSSRTLTVGGYGTTPAWGQLYGLAGKRKLFAEGLNFKFDSSGTGPSDHTTFYRKNIPVLFYFTGLHTDYHKPSDDYEKINFMGQLNIVKHIFALTQATSQMNQKLVFTKTREAQTTTSARFTVTLGIMPDYSFPGAGVRIDGVSENKPAQKAGLRAGDIITSLGDYKISSVEGYMQALSKFKKGDKTTITFTRGKDVLNAGVEF